MTLAMPDAVNVAALPSGYGQYLGYADGAWPTEFTLAKRFPRARLVILTVTGKTLAADGCDIEPGNLTAKDGAQWARQKLNRQPGSRPVLYASVTGEPGYGMGNVRDALVASGVPRGQVRLLSAHYGRGEHICGPYSCGEIAIDMDGTQWTNDFNLTGTDMSVLDDGFFGTWTEEIMQQLPLVQQGDTGPKVRRIQALCTIYGAPVNEDGIYGPNTKGAVVWVQARAGIGVDGIVGPQTWPVLLGIA